MSVQDYYDDFVEHQAAIGINQRHRAIIAGLRRFGWRPADRILEIGCGIGTLTELLAAELDTEGAVVAIDLSPRSIQVAKSRLTRFSRVELHAGDILDLEISGSFDVIVLPDVIEHIPAELHRRLFARLAGMLSRHGFMLANYPNPYYLQWCRQHRPEVLQIIDQPIKADALLADVYASGLYLHFLETYSIWIREGDYVLAVFRRAAAANTFTPIPEPRRTLRRRAVGRVRRLLR
jgi:2-polyprenyl-3-methyl-5-hydroxy-6-metoxy-1,4-benzoquinol methylase